MSTADQTPSMPPMPEPVEWQYRTHFGGARGWSSWYTEDKVEIDAHPDRHFPAIFEVRGLYTAEQVQAVADERVRAAMSLRPMDQAPTDGTEVDLWHLDLGGEYHRETDAKFLNGEWVRWLDRESDFVPTSLDEHTRWTPIPRPTLSLAGSKEPP